MSPLSVCLGLLHDVNCGSVESLLQCNIFFHESNRYIFTPIIHVFYFNSLVYFPCKRDSVTRFETPFLFGLKTYTCAAAPLTNKEKHFKFFFYKFWDDIREIKKCSKIVVFAFFWVFFLFTVRNNVSLFHCFNVSMSKNLNNDRWVQS